MSWLDRYKEQAGAWRQKAQIHFSRGEESKGNEAKACAEVYDRLADECGLTFRDPDCVHNYHYFEDNEHTYTGYLERCTECGDIIQIPQ